MRLEIFTSEFRPSSPSDFLCRLKRRTVVPSAQRQTVRAPMRTKINTELNLKVGSECRILFGSHQTANKWKRVGKKTAPCAAHSKWVTFRYRTTRRVSGYRSVTCLRLLLGLSAHYNNNPVYSRPFPASMFRTGVPELMSHARPCPGLYSPACSALPGTLNTSPWSCFLVHGPSLRTYCKWFTPVLGPRPAPERGREARQTLSKSECRVALLWLSWKYVTSKKIHYRLV